MSVLDRLARTGIRALSRFVLEAEVEPDSPTPGRFYSGWRDDYSIDSSVRQLTPARLGEAMRAADEGDTASQYEVFERVEQDAHITAVLGKRRRAIVARQFQIAPAIDDDGSADSKRAQQASDLCNEVVFGRWGYGGIRNLRSALRDLTDAIGKGFALGQIVWRNDSGRWVVDDILRWPQVECVLGTINTSTRYAQDHDDIRIVTDLEPVNGIPLQPGQWIAHIHKEWSVPIARASLLRSLTWFYLFKRFSWKDWSIFIERYGMPIRVGKYHSGATDDDRAAIWKAVRQLGKDAACLMPEQSTIELIEPKSGSSGGELPFPRLITECNNEISKAVLGNTMTTEQGERGARSLGEVYERGEVESTDIDCSTLAESIRRQLIEPIVKFNLGSDYPIPECSFSLAPQHDLVREIKVDTALVKELNLPLERAYFYQKYHRPTPSTGDLINSTEIDTEPSPAPTPSRSSSRGAVALADTIGAATDLETRIVALLHAHDRLLIDYVIDGGDVPDIDGLQPELLSADLWGRLAIELGDSVQSSVLSKLKIDKLKEEVLRRGILTATQLRELSADYYRKAKGLAEDAASAAALAVSGLAERTVSAVTAALRSAGLTRRNPYRLDTIAVNATWGSISHGRYQQKRSRAARKPEAIWKYITAGDDRVRPSHADMDGRVYPWDDPIWQTWYPPNGHNCRCLVMETVANYDTITEGRPDVEPDDGWESNPQDWLNR